MAFHQKKFLSGLSSMAVDKIIHFLSLFLDAFWCFISYSIKVALLEIDLIIFYPYKLNMLSICNCERILGLRNAIPTPVGF